MINVLEMKKESSLSCKFEVFLPASSGTCGSWLLLSSHWWVLATFRVPHLAPHGEGRDLLVGLERAGAEGCELQPQPCWWLEIPTGVRCVLCVEAMAQW